MAAISKLSAAARVALVVICSLGCEDKRAVPGPVPVAPVRSDAALALVRADASPIVVDANSSSPRFVYGANRCGECHVATQKQWTRSGHSKASTSPIYLAMRGQATDCERCHTPLRELVEPETQALKEGVTCLVCHRIANVAVERTSATFALNLDDNTMFGPLCDARKHYFHKMGCSPLHDKSQLCAACHHWLMPTQWGTLPVFTEFQEWQASPYAKRGVECQGCHMPGTARQVAVGSPTREEVHDHGMDGNQLLRDGAVTLSITVASAQDKLRVTAVVHNAKAGHHLPTGLPGRQLLLRLLVLNDELREEDRVERIYTKMLVDEHDNEVPFHAARRVKSDTRLMAQEKRTETVTLTATAGGRLVAELVWRPLSPAIAAALKITAPGDEILVKAEVPFMRSSSDGRRSGLPATVVAEPME